MPELSYTLQLAGDEAVGTVDEGHALLLGLGSDGFGLGFGAQFLYRPAIGPLFEVPFGRGELNYRKYTMGVALGSPRALSLGVNYNFFGSDYSDDLDSLDTFDVGLQWRPSSGFGAAFRVRDLNTPFVEGLDEALAPRWAVGVALRAFDGAAGLEQ